jgi:hypothetical protein
LLSIFRKGPKFVDREFADLSLMLTQEDGHPTYRRDLLEGSKLDFSVESLRHIDSYLEILHQHPPEEHDLFRVALRCGAYIGEVMRKQVPGTWHWVGYDEAAKHSKVVAGFGRSVATAGILWKNDEEMSFPLGKVCKFIENGNEDSVRFFAEALIGNERQRYFGR